MIHSPRGGLEWGGERRMHQGMWTEPELGSSTCPLSFLPLRGPLMARGVQNQ